MKKTPLIFTLFFAVIIFAAAANAQPTPSPTPQDDKIYQLKEVDEKPVYTKKPRASARYCSGSGSAKVRVVLHKSGRVGKVELAVPSRCAIFNDNVINAAKQIEFEPAKKDGKAVSVVVVAEYSFWTTL